MHSLLGRLPRMDLVYDKIGFVVALESRYEGDCISAGASSRRVFPRRATFALSAGLPPREFRSGAVVLLQPNHLCRRKFLLIRGCSGCRAAPTIDGLIIVADDDNVPCLFQKADELKLRAVCVLVLVDKDELKAIAVVLEDVRVREVPSPKQPACHQNTAFAERSAPSSSV